MKGYLINFITTIILLFIALSFVNQSYSYTTNQSASVVIGQPNMTSGSANQGGSAGGNTLRYPYGIATDGTHVAISDYQNRVLIYNSIPTGINASADLVLGQEDFTSTGDRGGIVTANTLSNPGPIIFANGKLIISDFGNCRVLIWNTIPSTSGASADVVIGQSSMSDSSCSTSSTTFSGPWGIDYDSTSGKLLVTDFNANRLLIYNSIPTTNGAAADVVVGQSNFSSNSPGTTSSTLDAPYTARVIQNKLFIVDTNNDRVLIYDSIPTTNGAVADVVIGQTNMTSGLLNQGGSVRAFTFNYPTDILYDGSKLFVQDSYNNRVVIFNSIPTSNNASADSVIGQINLTSNTAGTTASTFNHTEGGFASTSECGKLIVNDSNNNRVLIFNNESPCLTPTATPTPTTVPASTSGPSYSGPILTQIPQLSDGSNGGGVALAIGDSSTGGQRVLSIIEPDTFNFTAFLSSILTQPPSLTSPSKSITKEANTSNAKLYGGADGILGIKSNNITRFQVGHIQKIWYKSYSPGYSTDNAAIIIPELQHKPSIVALSYSDFDLVIPGRQPVKGKQPTYNPKNFKLANSLDGFSWKVLPTSVVDVKNHTVAALHKVGGYYMIVGR